MEEKETTGLSFDGFLLKNSMMSDGKAQG